MSTARWTEEQLAAITARHSNLLVAAAAGAGKTAVLVERIIRRVTDEKEPVDLDRLLIVTFTNAAAAEMRARLTEALAEALESNPGSPLLRRQMTLVGKASITTIHAFCMEVVKSHFHRLNLDPGFRILDETEGRLMKLEALNELFEDQYEKAEENKGFFDLLECYGGNRDDSLIMDMVLNLYEFVQSSPWPQDWLKEMTGLFCAPDHEEADEAKEAEEAEEAKDAGETGEAKEADKAGEAYKAKEADGPDFAFSPWGRLLMAAARQELEGMAVRYRAFQARLHQAEGLEKYLQASKEDLVALEGLISLLDKEETGIWDRLATALDTYGFGRLPIVKEGDKVLQEAFKRERDEVKDGIKKLRERFFIAKSSDLYKDLEALRPLMEILSLLVEDFSSRFEEKKSRRSVVDFNDLEHYCLEVLAVKTDESLVPTEAARAYRERFEEIFIDEYQDSNLVQELLLSLISRVDDNRPNIFMVGDVKQSIYRFRQARPDLFMEKYRLYAMEEGSPFRKILLYKNFRSRKSVVDAINYVFFRIMSQEAGELDYTEEEALYPGALYPEPEEPGTLFGGAAEFHLIETAGPEQDEGNAAPETEAEASSGSGEEDGGETVDFEESAEFLDAIRLEARVCARRILELKSPWEDGCAFQVFDKSRKGYRPLEFRDIVILLRTTSKWSEVFMEELAQNGIPAFADTGTGFFKSVEVEIMLSLLQIIDNPFQDIPLLAVLRSPLFSYTTDDLASIRLADRKACLYDALVKLAGMDREAPCPESPGEEALIAKSVRFLQRLKAWQDLSLHLPTDQLLWRLYSETGYYALVGASTAGGQRQANLRILFERAGQFEETSYKGLFHFIQFMDRLKSSQGDMGSAKTLGENDNVVRIMSIHKSKGLEFPVVFASGLGKKFNMQDMNKSILLHQDLGFGPDVVDTRIRLSYPSAAKLALREKIRRETLSEEMRILYVALTRAREKLILTGTVTDVAKACEKWGRLGDGELRLPAYAMLKATRYLDWVGPALMGHPHGGALREWGGVNGDLGLSGETEPSAFEIRRWHKRDVTGEEGEKAVGEQALVEWLNSALASESAESKTDDREVSRRLSWNYAFEGASRVPSKVSVTEMKRLLEVNRDEDALLMPDKPAALVKKPLFLEEKKGLSAAEIGTVLHFVMQHLELHGKPVEDQLRSMVEKDFLTEIQAKSVNTKRIRAFFQSDPGKRMLASKKVFREVPFHMAIPGYELFPFMAEDALAGEKLILQGVIDCFFEEEDGLVLLDYKTDAVYPGRLEELKNRYALQIRTYARALEKLSGKPVKNRYVYLFSSGEVLEF